MDDFDLTTMRRTLTTWRNREKDFATQQRLTNILNTIEEWRKAETDAHVRKEQLMTSIRSQWADFEKHIKGAA